MHHIKGKWLNKEPMSCARSHSSVSVYKDKIYVFGGGGTDFSSLSSVSVYNPASDTWETKSSMPTLHSGAAAITLDNKIYVIGGGFKQTDGTFKFLKTVEIYNPESDTWGTGPDMIMPHDYPAIAILDGYIYIMGGHHPDATEGGPKTDPGFNFCERLNPQKGQWEEIAPLNIPRFALSANILNGNIVVMGGVALTKEGFNNFDIIETYNPVTGKWKKEDNFSLPWPTAGQGSCIINNRLFIFGGYSGDSIQGGAAFHNPETKKWEKLPPTPIAIAAMGVGVINNSVYLVGGWGIDGKTPVNTLLNYTPDFAV